MRIREPQRFAPNLLVLLVAVASGCHSSTRNRSNCAIESPRPRYTLEVTAQSGLAGDISQASQIEPFGTSLSGHETGSNDDPFSGLQELDLNPLVAEVLKRNPSIPAMVAAWRSASEKYPQVVSLDDPMFGFMLAPATFGSDDVDFGWMVQTSQKIPWSGKRQLRGIVAQAEVDAAFQDIEAARIKLREAAKLAFFDYFLVGRELEINSDNVRIMNEFRAVAQNKYASNQVTQQDVLQAEVELADLSRRQIELNRMDEVARARINTLLHRVPNHSLPAPSNKLPIAADVPSFEDLRDLALKGRPDLVAQAARVRAEEAAVDLACREFYPDLEFVARYDSFWQPAESDLRPQVGINLNLPLRTERRRAAVQEAIARVTQRRAELERQIDEIQYDVHAAFARLNESQRVAKLYTDSILPASRQNVESAQANYEAGKLDFLRLIEAQRQLIGYREKQFEAEVEYHRRLAELESVVAGPVQIEN
jgi:outer membrane protein, heavy metal efflux system